MGFKVEVVVCEMGEAECSLQIGIDTRSSFLQLPWEINEGTRKVFFIFSQNFSTNAEKMNMYPGSGLPCHTCQQTSSGEGFWFKSSTETWSTPQNSYYLYFQTCSNYIILFHSFIIEETCIDTVLIGKNISHYNFCRRTSINLETSTTIMCC